MSQERAGMASKGEGSGGSARQREAGDAKSVSDAAGRGTYGGAAGGMADIPGDDGAGAGAGAGQSGQGSSQNSEAGGGENSGDLGGGNGEESTREEGRVERIPEDIPADGSGDDQVARQIREAAVAEQDPIIRDALWDEYRKQTGLKKN